MAAPVSNPTNEPATNFHHVIETPIPAEDYIQVYPDMDKVLKVNFLPPYLGWTEPHDSVLTAISRRFGINLAEALVHRPDPDRSTLSIQCKEIPDTIKNCQDSQIILGQRRHGIELSIDVQWMGSNTERVSIEGIPLGLPKNTIAKCISQALGDKLHGPVKLYRNKAHRQDEAVAILRAEREDIPHFLTISYLRQRQNGDTYYTTASMSLKMRGRRQVCRDCGQTGHHANAKSCKARLQAPKPVAAPRKVRTRISSDSDSTDASDDGQEDETSEPELSQKDPVHYYSDQTDYEKAKKKKQKAKDRKRREQKWNDEVRRKKFEEARKKVLDQMNRKPMKGSDDKEPIMQKKRDANFSGTNEEDMKRQRIEVEITTSTPLKVHPDVNEPRPNHSPISASDGDSGQAHGEGSGDDRDTTIGSLRIDINSPRSISEVEEELLASTQDLIPPGQKRMTEIDESSQASTGSINIPSTPYSLV